MNPNELVDLLNSMTGILRDDFGADLMLSLSLRHEDEVVILPLLVASKAIANACTLMESDPEVDPWALLKDEASKLVGEIHFYPSVPCATVEA